MRDLLALGVILAALVLPALRDLLAPPDLPVLLVPLAQLVLLAALALWALREMLAHRDRPAPPAFKAPRAQPERKARKG